MSIVNTQGSEIFLIGEPKSAKVAPLLVDQKINGKLLL